MVWVNDIIQGILAGGEYALFACGLSLMFGVMKVINLAHGDLAIVGAYVALGVIAVTHVPFLWSIPIMVVLMAACGYALQRSLIQTALDRSELTTLIVTFGLSIVIENGLLQFFTADTRGIGVGSSIESSSFSIGSQIQIGWLPVIIFIVAVIMLLALQYFLSASRYGRMIRAVADDREAALLSGINARHVFGVAAAIAFGTVGLGGVAFGMAGSVAPADGSGTILLWAFASVVIGGIGSLWGTLLGGIVLGVTEQLAQQHNSSWDPLAGYVVFLVVLALRPQGLTAWRSRA